MSAYPSRKYIKRMVGTLFKSRYNPEGPIYIILEVTVEREGGLIRAAPLNDLTDWMTFSVDSFPKYYDIVSQ